MVLGTLLKHAATHTAKHAAKHVAKHAAKAAVKAAVKKQAANVAKYASWKKTGSGSSLKPDRPGATDGEVVGEWTWMPPPPVQPPKEVDEIKIEQIAELNGPAGGLESWTAGGGVEWVLIGGAVVRSQEDIKSALLQRLEDNVTVTVVARSGRRAMITKPCLGWISLQSGDGKRVFARPKESVDAAQSKSILVPDQDVPPKRVHKQSEWPVAVESEQPSTRVYPQLPELVDHHAEAPNDDKEQKTAIPKVRSINDMKVPERPAEETPEEGTVYEVCVPHIACRTEIGLDSPLVMQVQHGAEVHVVETNGRRARITKPCHGWISSHHKDGSTQFIKLPGSAPDQYPAFRTAPILYVAIAEPFMPARLGQSTKSKLIRRIKPGEVLNVIEVVGRRARTINPDGWVSLKTEAGKALVKLKDEYEREMKENRVRFGQFPQNLPSKMPAPKDDKIKTQFSHVKDNKIKVVLPPRNAKAQQNIATTSSETQVLEITDALMKALVRIEKLETAATSYHSVMMENHERIQKLEGVVGEQQRVIALLQKKLPSDPESAPLDTDIATAVTEAGVAEPAPDAGDAPAPDAPAPPGQNAASADWQLIVDATPIELAAKKSEPEANPFSHNPFAVFTPPSSEQPDDGLETVEIQKEEPQNEPPDADSASDAKSPDKSDILRVKGLQM